ncbi:hypothetical protein JCM10914A_54990 [Paenibacillus sp. JCM 10914]|nr:hypothetical protein [Paenibacillus sp. JCM 10914]
MEILWENIIISLLAFIVIPVIFLGFVALIVVGLIQYVRKNKS